MIVDPAPIRRILDGLLANAACAADRDRQRTLLGVLLAAGLLAAGAFPVWLVVGAPGGGFGAGAFAFGLAPLGIAAALAKTGQSAVAEGLAFAAITGLVTVLAAASGGLGSPALVWLAMVPLLAAVSGEPRWIWPAAATGAAAVGALLVHDMSLDVVPPPPPAWVSGASVVMAMLVAAALARRLSAAGGRGGASVALANDRASADQNPDGFMPDGGSRRVDSPTVAAGTPSNGASFDGFGWAGRKQPAPPFIPVASPYNRRFEATGRGASAGRLGEIAAASQPAPHAAADPPRRDSVAFLWERMRA